MSLDGLKPIRVGVLGAGFISDSHIRAIKASPGVSLAAIADPSRQRAEGLARQWGCENVFSSAAELLAFDVDAVHVLVPPHIHAKVAMECLAARRNVLVEKPMAVTVEEARELAQSSEKSGTVAAVNHNATFHPAFRKLVQAARSRAFGELQHVNAVVNLPLRQISAGQFGHWMFQQPQNIVLEQAPHPLSQIIYLLGRVRRAQALPSGKVAIPGGKEFFTVWQIALECERGTASIFLSFGCEYYEATLHAIGQDAAGFADLKRNVFRLSEKTRFMEPVDNYIDAMRTSRQYFSQGFGRLIDYSRGFIGLIPPQDAFLAGLRASVQDFYAAVRGEHEPSCPLSQGEAVIEGCYAIAGSAFPQMERAHV